MFGKGVGWFTATKPAAEKRLPSSPTRSDRPATPGIYLAFSDDGTSTGGPFDNDEEETNGIEIVLFEDAVPPPSILYNFLTKCNKVYSKIFLLPPLLTNTSTGNRMHRRSDRAYSPDRRRRRHRVPIMALSPGRSSPSKRRVRSPNAAGIRSMLIDHFETDATDEMHAVQQELKKCQQELDQLEEDREELETTYLRKIVDDHQERIVWDAHGLLHLDTARRKGKDNDYLLSTKERTALTIIRGICFTAYIHDEKGRKEMVSAMGHFDINRNHSRRVRPTMITMTPDTCRESRAGESIRQFSLIGGKGSDTSSFFLQKDNGDSLYWGKLPPRLFTRLKQTRQYSSKDINYLSTGPGGSYYAELKNGTCVWGTAVRDDLFHEVVRKWEVYRVAFGPLIAIDDDFNDQFHYMSSWIVVGLDGKAAWRNIPDALHTLMMEKKTGIAEVSLGRGSTYFIQFLDGTISYCLPQAVADVCEKIEQHGGFVTNVSLHVDSDDFIIRHTETEIFS